MEEIKKLIENKLAMIDIKNKNSKGETKIGRWDHELRGIKQTLRSLGIILELNVNPYFYENKEPSTYKLTIEI